MNVLIEMATLSMSRPTVGASNEEVAGWLEAKARLHEQLAVEGGCDQERERTLAANAHRRAMNLIGTAA
ncbi:hypothetical protein [Smaragdicoccus niigatensis]|uniref:hypothetical protein n=1 Tax=Smaragdicoccus niigatensis TaxID=359359 RepID=UPI00039C5D97|nr:hypothetical protein [Smaragdicoccus niigatensis]